MKFLQCLEGFNNYDDSRKVLESHGLIVKDYSKYGMYLIKYNKDKSNMVNTDVQKCRGVVMTLDNRILCVPPSKSIDINYFMESVDNFTSIEFEEFIDGTMIQMFYFNDKWNLSTRSSIGANGRWHSKKRFSELFEEASANLQKDKLEIDTCYTFVLNHPENQIVKKYEESNIVLVKATKIVGDDINNISLDDIDIGVDKPKKFQFTDLDDAMKTCYQMNYDEQGLVLKYNKDGVQIRSKIRNPKYNNAKMLRGNSNNLKFQFLELRQQGFLNKYLELFPQYADEFDRYRNELFAVTDNLFNCYKALHVCKPKANIQQIPFEYRPLCYDLHGMYMKTGNITTFARVKNFINTMDTARLLFVINYKLRDNKGKGKGDVNNQTEVSS